MPTQVENPTMVTLLCFVHKPQLKNLLGANIFLKDKTVEICASLNLRGRRKKVSQVIIRLLGTSKFIKDIAKGKE